MEKIAVVTDSNSGITQEEAAQHGVYVIPMIFYVKDSEYKEGISLDDDTFFNALREGAKVSTSQTSLADLTEMWEELLEENDKIIYIPMSKALSGGFAAASALSEEYEGRVLVIDGARISVTQASMVYYAKKLADEGVSAEKIKECLLKEAMKAGIYITVESLEYLRRGGRISAAAAVAGNVLNIKPVLQIQGGLLELLGKARGQKKAKKMMEEALKKDVERFLENEEKENIHIYAGHADAEEEVKEWAKELETLFPDFEIEIVKLPKSICCHVGPGTIGTAVCVH